MSEHEEARLLVLEDQMERLMGNGQPGIIHEIWTRLESNSRMVNIGIGIALTLQVVTAGLVALIAGGVIKIR